MKRRRTFLPAPDSRGRQVAFVIVGTVLAVELATALLLVSGAPW